MRANSFFDAVRWIGGSGCRQKQKKIRILRIVVSFLHDLQWLVR